MKRIIKSILLSLALCIVIIGQVTPAYAAMDGQLREIIGTDVKFRSGPGTGYSVIMTCWPGEAIAGTGSSQNGFSPYKGWYAGSGSTVNGWVSDSDVARYNFYYAKTALNMYSSESDGSYTGAEIPAWDRLYATNNIFYTYSNLYYLYVNYTINGNNVTTLRNSYVHTQFRSSHPSSYLVQNDGYPRSW